MAERLSTYAEMAGMLDELPIIVKAARRGQRLSERELARRIGLSPMTLSRVEQGREFSSVSLRAILLWLDNPQSTPEGDANGQQP